MHQSHHILPRRLNKTSCVTPLTMLSESHPPGPRKSLPERVSDRYFPLFSRNHNKTSNGERCKSKKLGIQVGNFTSMSKHLFSAEICMSSWICRHSLDDTSGSFRKVCLTPESLDIFLEKDRRSSIPIFVASSAPIAVPGDSRDAILPGSQESLGSGRH